MLESTTRLESIARPRIIENLTAFAALSSLVLALGCGSATTESNRSTMSSQRAARPAPQANAQTNAVSAQSQATCSLTPVYYAYDSSELDTTSRNSLAADARCLQTQQNRSTSVVGMTDSRGTEEYNLALGERRAQSAARYLTSLGVEQSRIQSQSVGEEYARGTDETSWSRDRRSDLRSE